MLIWCFILLSIAILGLVRTAVLIIPFLFSPSSLEMGAGIWMSFFAAAFLIVPYQNGGFIFSKLSREKAYAILFLSSCLFGALFYPVPVYIFSLGAFVPAVCIYALRFLKLAPSEIYIFPKWARFIPIGLLAMTRFQNLF